MNCHDCKHDDREKQRQKAFKEEKDRIEFMGNKQQELFDKAQKDYSSNFMN